MSAERTSAQQAAVDAFGRRCREIGRAFEAAQAEAREKQHSDLDAAFAELDRNYPEYVAQLRKELEGSALWRMGRQGRR